MDYTIEARLDPATATLTGQQTAVIHNNSPTEMTSIQLRLDQNILRPNVVRLRAAPEITDGMRVSRLAVNGENVDLNAPPPRRGRGGGGLSPDSRHTDLTRPQPAFPSRNPFPP